MLLALVPEYGHRKHWTYEIHNKCHIHSFTLLDVSTSDFFKALAVADSHFCPLGQILLVFLHPLPLFCDDISLVWVVLGNVVPVFKSKDKVSFLTFERLSLFDTCHT